MQVFNPVLLLAALLCLPGLPASAQMVLPGAVAPTPEGATVSPDTHRAPRPKPRARGADQPVAATSIAKVPAAANLAGQRLFLNGRKSQVTFVLRDKALAVSRLVLAGEKMSSSRDTCQVEVPGLPVDLADKGKPNGLARVELALQACPIAFDVLDGAVVALGEPRSCEFKESDCRVSPLGLWGPQAGALGPEKAKAIERARAQADAAVRTNFKLLLSTTKDKPSIVDYAREQAGFSSTREETCRDYAGEGRHGFCATKLTEARAAALRAKFEVESARKQLRKQPRSGG